MSDEFIHPFADGNGRLGRLWQTLILEQWNPLLGQLPVESMVHNHKQAYYRAINSSTQQTDSSPFIEFMLGVIVETIDSGSAPTPQVSKLITVLNKSQSAMNRAGLQQALALKDRHSFRERYLKPALVAGLVEILYKAIKTLIDRQQGFSYSLSGGAHLSPRLLILLLQDSSNHQKTPPIYKQ